MFSRLFGNRRGKTVIGRRAPGLSARVTLRPATGEDDAELARLAALYDRRLPSGPLLVAEVDGEIQAAVTLTGAQELMEPYLPTAALVELLALRAKQLRDQMTPAELAEADGSAEIRVLARVTHLPRTRATERCLPAANRLCD